MVNYTKHRRKLEKMYEDRCSISRWVTIKKPNGANGKELQAVLSDQPCRISQKALGSNNQTDTKNNIAYETKIFISPDVEIKQGDVINVTRNSVIRKYNAGEAFIYPTHQEISIQRDTEA